MTDTTPTQPMDDDVVVRRLYAYGKWKLDSVAHFGGDDTGVADMCLLRDADGSLFIPAASIAGAARSFLARQSELWTKYKEGKESRELKRLFGGADEGDTMSALIVADATCKQKQAKTPIRDGVRVNSQSGSAAAGAKFDVEVVEHGTEFELRFECVIRHGDDSDALAELFLALLYGFQQGDIRLGARTRRGYGHGKVASWGIRDLQMNNRGDVLAWLRDDAWSQPKSSLTPHPLPDKRQYFCIEADFELRTSLLIRSASADPGSPDTVHLHYGEKPVDEKSVVPGTSFAGAFRHRAALIAHTLCWHKDLADKDAVCEMFGPIHEQKRDKAQQESDQAEPEGSPQEVHDEERDETQQKELWASRVWIEEQLVENVEYRWQDRVAIDRFTGGSLQSALFNEKPIYPLSLKNIAEEKPKRHIRLTLTLEEPDDAEIGLLLLTLRDFWHGHAALGGETSNGRGTLQGIKARLKFKRSASSVPDVWKFSHKDKRMTLEEGDKAFLECCVEKAQGYANDPDGSRRPVEKGETTDA